MSVVKDLIDRVFFTSARVAKVTEAGDRFRLVDLEGDALTTARIGHGDKIQVHASSFALRTYTPIAWDRARGRMRLCAYAHGGGPGSAWTRSVREGDTCSFFGPRCSVDFAKTEGQVVLFGDETSIGVGASLRELRGTRAHLVFEATSVDAVTPALDALALANAHVVARTADDDHLRALSDRVASLVTKDTTVVLTGRAKSIVALRSHLRAAGIAAPTKAKTYWAEGRAGLD